MFKKAALSAAIASSLIAAPIAAQAASADRSSSAVKGEQLAGFGIGWLLGLAIVIGVIVIAVSDGDENVPTSP